MVEPNWVTTTGSGHELTHRAHILSCHAQGFNREAEKEGEIYK